jgi:deoxyribodipyrimidine photolyase-related protein
MKGDTPLGGKYNFDKLNRKNPKQIVPVKFSSIGRLSINYYKRTKAAKLDFSNNYGDEVYGLYPCTHIDSKQWFQNFLKEKLSKFAKFQDVHYENNPYLFHSVITPMLNIGLLTPAYVIKQTLLYARKNKIDLIPLEAFIRQIIGWREYMRYMYLYGDLTTKLNFFENKNKLYKSYYDGTTGIGAIDNIIREVSQTGYAHHIVRLMWLGNFFLLTQTKPSLVYKWFMEMFVDSYDWVMIPNVIGMSQYADGGTVATRPYFSSANYLKKMSNFISSEDIIKWNSLYCKFLNDKPQLTKLYIVSNWVKYWKAKPGNEKNKILKSANKILLNIRAS